MDTLSTQVPSSSQSNSSETTNKSNIGANRFSMAKPSEPTGKPSSDMAPMSNNYKPLPSTTLKHRLSPSTPPPPHRPSFGQEYSDNTARILSSRPELLSGEKILGCKLLWLNLGTNSCNPYLMLNSLTLDPNWASNALTTAVFTSDNFPFPDTPFFPDTWRWVLREKCKEPRILKRSSMATVQC